MKRNDGMSAGWISAIVPAVTLVLSTAASVVVFTEPLGRFIVRKLYLYDHGRGETEVSSCIAMVILTCVGLAIGIALNHWRELKRYK